MEAHAGTINIGTPKSARPGRRRLAEILAAVRRRLEVDPERAHARQVNGTGTSVPGSEHAHLLRRPRGF